MQSGWTRLRRFWRPGVRDDVDDEVAFHVEMRVEQFIASGLTREEAERRARALFGNVDDVSEKLVDIGSRRRRRMDLWESAGAVFMDLPYAARSLRKHWAFSLSAIVTLSLGIGASTAIFSVVNAVLIRPLPYRDADRVGVITQDLHARGVADFPMSPGDVPDIRAQATLFDGIAAIRTGRDFPFSIKGRAPEPLVYASVTPNIFDVLGVPVSHGRNFTVADGTSNTRIRTPSGPPAWLLPRIGILGYAVWQRRFNGDSSIIGQSIVGPWGPMLVVGIASPNAVLLFPPSLDVEHEPDVWEALRANLDSSSRQSGGFRVITRMKPGVSLDTARRQIDQIGADLRGREPLRMTAAAYLRLEPMKDYLVGGVRSAILALMVAVLFLLLIACANVGNLLLARAAQRERELAVRAAIGGSAWRIVRQLLAESALLATVAAIVGVVLAKLGIILLVRLAPANLPRLADVSLDRTVLVFTVAATFASTLVFGLIPAIRASRPHVADLLRANGRVSAINSATRLRNTVIVAEFALSFVLLIGCGLMVRSFVALTQTELGFDPNGMLTFTLTNRGIYSPADRIAFIHQVHDRLAAIPDIVAATASTGLPLDGSNTMTRWGPKAALSDDAQFRQASAHIVLPGYFEAMKTPVIAGRAFTDDDARDALPKAIVIDDAMAKRAFGNESAIGKPLVVGRQERTVVGVVAHERQTSLAGEDQPVIYLPWTASAPPDLRWAIRVSGNPVAFMPQVHAAIASVSPTLIVNELQPMNAFVDKAMAATRFALVLIGVFAAIAAVLAAVGLYGVLSSVVRQRTPEIGIRMAFGADPSSIFSNVIGRGLRLSAIGIALGVGLALATTRLMTSMLVGVRPSDPATFVAMTTVFFFVAFIACWLPARRAAALDPTDALREDAM